MPRPWSIAELNSLALPLPAPPRERGIVRQVCVRPGLDQRSFPETLELSPERGAIGDRWEHRTWRYLPDGRPDPRVQVAIANATTIAWLQELTGNPHHPGDTLLVDFDLAATHLPSGSLLCVGSAVVEVSDVENDACAKFAKQFGSDVFAWIRAEENRAKRWRGLFARVVQGGVVRVGDSITHPMLPTSPAPAATPPLSR